MKERPIMFSPAMVVALLQGRKTQTRRLLQPKIPDGYKFNGWNIYSYRDPIPRAEFWYAGQFETRHSHFGFKGDRLWVRESLCRHNHFGLPLDKIPQRNLAGQYIWSYNADYIEEHVTGRKHAMYMPRVFSRITLDIEDVQPQRLQDISREDAIAEGLASVTKDGHLYKYGVADRDGWPGNDDCGWHWHTWEVDPVLFYAKLWDSLHGEKEGHSWKDNPWIWRIVFKANNLEPKPPGGKLAIPDCQS